MFSSDIMFMWTDNVRSLSVTVHFLEYQSHSLTVGMFKNQIRKYVPFSITKERYYRANPFSLWAQTALRMAFSVNQMSIEIQGLTDVHCGAEVLLQASGQLATWWLRPWDGNFRWTHMPLSPVGCRKTEGMLNFHAKVVFQKINERPNGLLPSPTNHPRVFDI